MIELLTKRPAERYEAAWKKLKNFYITLAEDARIEHKYSWAQECDTVLANMERYEKEEGI